MRIVAGSLRGRAIEAPAGTLTRPTTDRVREALFSSLYSLRGDFRDAVVLDAFAGSGALGIEALSRGARRAVFYESDTRAAGVLKRNLVACSLGGGQAVVVRRDVLSSPPSDEAHPFDLVFLDPPYAYEAGRVLQMVASLAESGSLALGAVVAYEHALESADAVRSAADEVGLHVVAMKRYGKTAVTMLRNGLADGQGDRADRAADGCGNSVRFA